MPSKRCIETAIAHKRLAAVARRRGITRQHVHQLLRAVTQRGLFCYRSDKAVFRQRRARLRDRTAQSILAAVPRAETLYEIAAHHRLPLGVLADALPVTTVQDLRRLLQERRVSRRLANTLKRYHRLARRLHRIPSLYAIQRHDPILYGAIGRYWGSVTRFRLQHQFPAPMHEMTRRRQLREITIKGQLEQVLMTRPLRPSDCRGQTARRVVQTFLAEGTVILVTEGKRISYYRQDTWPSAA